MLLRWRPSSRLFEASVITIELRIMEYTIRCLCVVCKLIVVLAVRSLSIYGGAALTVDIMGELVLDVLYVSCFVLLITMSLYGLI